MERQKIILDTDPAMGMWLGADIDDDLAIMFLLASPEVEILGITTTYGNSTGGRTYRDAVELLGRAGRSDIPVFQGAGWMSRKLDRETDAGRFIRETIRSQPGEISMVTVGPLTNLGAAIHSDPELMQDSRQLVMMGGRSVPGASEFNFSAHPAASSVVLGSSVRKFVATLDLCFQVVFTMQHLKQLEGRPELLIHHDLGSVRRWLKFNRFIVGLLARFEPALNKGGFFPWDAIAASYLVAPDLFSEIGLVQMDMHGKKMVISEADDERYAVELPAKVDASRFMELFLERLGSLVCD